MDEDEIMAARIASYRSLVPKLTNTLKTFQSSSAQFRVLASVHPNAPFTPQDPSASTAGESPKTLFILDSSFNPPSIAHLALAHSALKDAQESETLQKPSRLLLLFATTNADKTPSPSAFAQRLTLMTILAGDLLHDISGSSSGVQVDIGVTTAPYYTDKSSAISSTPASASSESTWYPSNPTHVHLIGFDTVIRLFNPKYYPSFTPPLSALAPYFDDGSHRLRVTLRPDDANGDADAQRQFLTRLSDGEMESIGGRSKWANQIEMVAPNPKTGVSSTKIREAAAEGNWNSVEELCTPSVAAWVRQEELCTKDG